MTGQVVRHSVLVDGEEVDGRMNVVQLEVQVRVVGW